MLASSSKGNSALVTFDGDAVLIDAGISAKRIKDAINSVGCPLGCIRAIFITHEHADHIGGLEVLSHNINVPIYAPAGCCGEIMRVCPATGHNLIPISPGDTITAGCMEVRAYETPHDSADSAGYRIAFPDGSELGYATDIGHITKDVVAILDGCKYVVVESNHDIPRLMSGPYPQSLKKRIAGDYGHLANQSIIKMLPYLVKNGARHIILAHLSEENNTPELALASAKAALEEYGFDVSGDIETESVYLAVADPQKLVCI